MCRKEAWVSFLFLFFFCNIFLMAMNTPELKKYWDGFAKAYSDDHEREMITGVSSDVSIPLTISVARTMMTCIDLDIKENANVLEIACGSGQAYLDRLILISKVLLLASLCISCVPPRSSPPSISQARWWP
jgi:hypothetical protein